MFSLSPFAPENLVFLRDGFGSPVPRTGVPMAFTAEIPPAQGQ